MLSDAQKRAVYDRHGAAGLSGGVPTGPDGSTFRYSPSSADDIFEARDVARRMRMRMTSHDIRVRSRVRVQSRACSSLRRRSSAAARGWAAACRAAWAA